MRTVKKETVNRKFLTFQYCVVNVGYFAATCCVFGYAMILMLAKGFRASEIGIIIALGNFFSMLMQPVLAGFADRSTKYSVHQISMLILVLAAVLSGIFLVIPGFLPAIALLFILMQVMIKAIQPLINSINVYYVNRGINMDFGIPRSMGTLTYAATSAILGFSVKYFGADSIVIALAFGAILAIIGILTMPLLSDAPLKAQTEKADEKNKSGDKKKSAGIGAFIRKYPMFCMTFVGMVCLFVVHNMVESYMIQILGQWGGDSVAQGNAITIAALAEFIPMMCFGWLQKKLGTKKLLITAGVSYALRAAVYLAATAIFHVYLGQLFQALTYALLIPASVIYANECMEPEDTVMGQAVMSAAIVAGGMIASLLGGFLVDYLGVRVMLLTNFGFGVTGAVIVILSLRRGKKHE